MKNTLRFLAIATMFISTNIFAGHINNMEEFKKAKVQPGYTIIEFGADWCAYCKKLTPAWERLSNNFQSQIKFHKVNTDKVPQVTQPKDKGGEGIEGLPTILFLKDGKEIFRERGGLSEEDFEKTIRLFLKK